MPGADFPLPDTPGAGCRLRRAAARPGAAGNVPSSGSFRRPGGGALSPLIRLNAFSFGVSGFLLAMDTVVLPVLVLAVAPDNLKNTYLAMLGISGLLVAAITQPLVGRLSDRTRSPLGRRAPYLIWGICWVCACLAGVRMAPDFWTLFGVWVFVQVNLNIANGPGQALIRDLVPPERINAASSIKILLDAAGGVTLIFIAGTLIGLEAAPGVVDWRWLTLALLGVGLLAAGSVTCQTVLSRQPPPGRVRLRGAAPAGPPAVEFGIFAVPAVAAAADGGGVHLPHLRPVFRDGCGGSGAAGAGGGLDDSGHRGGAGADGLSFGGGCSTAWAASR